MALATKSHKKRRVYRTIADNIDLNREVSTVIRDLQSLTACYHGWDQIDLEVRVEQAYGDDVVKACLVAYRQETDEEVEQRIANGSLAAADLEQRERDEYLRLKKKFEG